MNFEILIEDNLQSYFFEELLLFNKKITTSLPIETIFYSSTVLNKFLETDKLFKTIENGKKYEKILGLKLLEIEKKEAASYKRALKDIGDTSLYLCGVFNKYIEKKMIDSTYYRNIGIISYKKLNNIEPSYLDVPNFYSSFAKSYDQIIIILNYFSKDFFPTVI